jgi:hypothetical protein
MKTQLCLADDELSLSDDVRVPVDRPQPSLSWAPASRIAFRFSLVYFPRLRAAAAMLWPDSTSRTASRLNSSVYRARFAFLIVISLN